MIKPPSYILYITISILIAFSIQITGCFNLDDDDKNNDSLNESIITAYEDKQAPDEVQNLKLTKGDTQLSLTWEEPSNIDYDGVKITCSPGNIEEIDISKGTKTKTVTGLTNDTVYTFILKTYDKSDNLSEGKSIQGKPEPKIKQAADIYTGANGSSPSYLEEHDSKLYFRATNDGTNNNLWYIDSDYNTSNPIVINPVSNDDIQHIKSYGGKLYFSVITQSNGIELCQYNSSDNSFNIIDLNPSGNGQPRYLTEYNNLLYFQGNDGTNGSELMVYDGSTSPSLAPNADINPGSNGSIPAYLTEALGILYFQAWESTNGIELYTYDGTNYTLVDINTGGNSSPGNFIEFNNKLFLSATNGSTGIELYSYNGSLSQVEADINPGSNTSSPQNFVIFNNDLYLRANNEMYKYISTGNVTTLSELTSLGISNATPLIVYNNKLYFEGEQSSLMKLWEFDGTNPPVEIAALDVETGFSDSVFPVIFNNKLYLSASDGSTGQELWVMNY